jgi:hypothetical protein
MLFIIVIDSIYSTDKDFEEERSSWGQGCYIQDFDQIRYG